MFIKTSMGQLDVKFLKFAFVSLFAGLNVRINIITSVQSVRRKVFIHNYFSSTREKVFARLMNESTLARLVAQQGKRVNRQLSMKTIVFLRF